MTTRAPASFEDLFTVPENAKAEIVNGELVQVSPTGDAPNYAAGEIFASLREYSRLRQFGRAVTDNAAFKVNLPGRSSFNPTPHFIPDRRRG